MINKKIDHSCPRPKVVVLLATYNGEQWLNEQIKSIINQENVETRVLVSDDGSSDSTVQIVTGYIGTGLVELLPKSKTRFGSACANFLHLIISANLGNAEYVALSDQDDLWFPGKLFRAISVLGQKSAGAYSSDVEAFWSNGKAKIIRKSQKQKRLDYLFSSPSPGCSFLFRRDVFNSVRSWLSAIELEAAKIRWHDWLLYAFVRSQGIDWYIDDYISLKYRQHRGNDTGANCGIRGKFWRLWFLIRGDYFREVLKISAVVPVVCEDVLRLKRLNIKDRLWLVCRASDYRREAIGVGVLMFAFLVCKKTRCEKR